MKRIVLLLPLLFAGPGCAMLGAVVEGRKITAEDVASDFVQTVKDAAQLADALADMPYSQEVVLGEATAAQLIYRHGLLPDPDANRYVSRVGAVVARVSIRPGIPYYFGILDTDSVNAYSCPGGYILITRGMLRLLEDEAELAFVLGHEVHHSAGKHVAQSLRDKKMQSFVGDKMRRGLKAVGGRIDMGPDNLNNLADLFATAILEDAFTPKQEDEADKEGLKMACHAGYEPAASFRVMDRFDKAGVGLASKDKYAHKSAVQRKEYLQKLVASEKFADGGSTNAERYRRSLPR